MNIAYYIIVSVMSSFILTMIMAPLVNMAMSRLGARQSILKYVDNHSSKAGTPTMGGVMFLVPIAIVSLIFGGTESRPMLMILASMMAFGLLGFLDDFIKVKLHHNEGLKAYQKIIGQLGIGIIVTLYCYYSSEIGSSIKLPFSDRTIDLNYFYIPFTLFVYLAITNAVNLTDGIDGLATSVTLIYIVAFIVILLVASDGMEGDYQFNLNNNSELILLSSVVGGLLAFFWHNSNKASIFMGDTGSLALGGLVGSIAIFSQNTLLIPIIGIMYMVSCISVIIQVFYYKITGGKRIFLMAPLHHHLQYKGYSESKIVAIYSIITVLASIVAFASIL